MYTSSTPNTGTPTDAQYLSSDCLVSLFYKYIALEELKLQFLIDAMEGICLELGLVGRCLVSTEGVNGTFAGDADKILLFPSELAKLYSGFEHIDYKYSCFSGERMPFDTLSVRRVDSLISCGSRIGPIIEDQIEFDNSYGGLCGTGIHLSPKDFHNELLTMAGRDDKGLILDIRNIFEYDIGRFTGACGLDTYYYSESWAAIEKRIEEYEAQHQAPPPKILMYCTGGIRCEKASAYLRAKGIENVYQLQGGIHKYLDEFAGSDENLFQGRNYVFDHRMSLVSNKTLTDADTDRKEEIIGKCIDCNGPYDVYADDRLCTVCRYPLLVCTNCVTRSVSKEFHCYRHRDLRFAYFTNLDIFTIAELKQQGTELEMMETKIMGSQARKSKRRTLRLQRLRVQNKIKDLLSG